MGCMAFSHGYGQIPPEEYSVEAIRGAYAAGCTFFDKQKNRTTGQSTSRRIPGRVEQRGILCYLRQCGGVIL